MKNEKRIKKEKSNRGQAVKNCSLLLVFCSMIFVFSCENPATSKDNVSALPAGKGSFSLTLSDTSRTILPVTPNLNDFAKYNLDFTPTNGGSAENVDRTNTTLPADPILLDPGTYKLVVNAYKDNNKTQLTAQGTLNNVTITAGKNTSATVTLEALLGGTGTFRWDITLPSGVTANMTITPGNTGGTNQQTVALTPPKATGSRTLNSGPYSLTFNLTKTDGKAVVWNELLYVYQNLESVFTFTFTDAHLSDSNYTVTYNRNNGTSNLTQSVLHGAALTVPADPTRNGCTFSGWYTDNDVFTNPWDFDNPIIESFTLYAKWEPITDVPGATLAAQLSWLQTNAVSNVDYTLGVTADESIAPQTLSYSNRSNITITLIGIDSNRTVSLSSNGAMFTVSSGVTLVLDNNITLQGRSSNNNSSVVRVNAGGTLIMNTGSVITGNTNIAYTGGGVYVGGTFTMNGGTISGNTVRTNASPPTANGGGVYVSGTNATFTMNGGTISGNTASSSTISYAYGGGVYVNSGTFTMSGGEISGNTATANPNYSSPGGGVYVGNGTFTKTGGTIYGYNVSDTINSNVVKDSSGAVLSYLGHAVYAYGSGQIIKHKETTAGPSVNLSYNYNGGSPVFSGDWDDVSVESVTGLANKLAWLQGYAQSNGSYTLEVDVDESIAPHTLSYSDRSNITITLIGGGASAGGANRTVSLSSNGAMFSVSSGVTLVLDNNITLQGRSSNNNSMVRVNSGGTLIMNTGSVITGNRNSSSGSSGGVYMSGTNATFIMNGGEISDNTYSYSGGGVYVSSGTFTMNGGEISGNTVTAYSSAYGGGVYVGGGTFTMNDGEISGNTVSYPYFGNSYSGGGGGVYVGSGTFTKTGGTITGYASDTVSGNVVKDRSSGAVLSYLGHAVYAYGSGQIIKRKETTAGPSVNLLYNYNGGSPVFSGGWDVDVPFESVTGLANKLAWLRSYAQSNSSYTLEVDADESIAPHNLSYSDRSNITITLVGIGTNRTVSLSSNDAMFTVSSSVTLILDNNITLQGRSSNTASLVRVNSDGTLIMNTGSAITGNTATGSSAVYGGGVYVDSGTFTMNGGTISGNTASTSSSFSSSYGGGVYVDSFATFTMSGGKISDNTASSSGSYGSIYGGGVYVSSSGIFTMEGGEISGNSGGGVYVNGATFTMSGTAKISGNTSSSSNGGGVYMNGGTFTMEGGEISGNTGSISTNGGGVYVSNGTFTMSSGTISGNTAGYGGGVYMYGGNATFTMSGGTISSNKGGFTTTNYNIGNLGGGGVYVYGATFTMSGGAISGNTSDSSHDATSYGGGVYVRRGTFTMSGTAKISGNTVSSDYLGYGGGECVGYDYVDGAYLYGTFTMNGGEISGNTAATTDPYSGNSGGGGVSVNGTFTKNGGTITGYASNTNNGNVVRRSGTVVNDRGHAVIVGGGDLVKRKETTAGPGVNFSFDGTTDPPTFSGGWDY